MPYVEEVKIYDHDFNPYSEPTEGSFAVVVPPVQGVGSVRANPTWQTCRERFAKNYNKETTAFWFCTKSDHHRFVADFIDHTENIIKVSGQEIAPSFCYSSQRSNVMLIQPSSFWNECYVKRSLLTLLVRAPEKANPSQKYQEVLLKNDYIRGTKNAVSRFLFGFTRYTGPIPDPATHSTQGWYALFTNQVESQIANLLVRPGNLAMEQKSNIGFGSLWS